MRQLLVSLAGVLALIGNAAAGTIEMKVNGMTCELCAQGIEKTLRNNPATTDVVVSLEHKLVALVTKDGSDIADAELTSALKDAGYDVTSIERTGRSLAAIRDSLKRPKS
jgi:copper chaperone CopZ